MSDFLANHKSAQYSAKWIEQTDNRLPKLTLDDFLKSMRIDDNVSQARSLRLLTSSMLAINAELKTHTFDAPLNEWQQHLYQDAVFNRAKSLVLENYRDIEATAKGHDRSEGMEARIDDYLQKSRESLRLLMGKSRMTVALV